MKKRKLMKIGTWQTECKAGNEKQASMGNNGRNYQ